MATEVFQFSRFCFEAYTATEPRLEGFPPLHKMYKCFDGYIEDLPVRQYLQHDGNGPFAVEIFPALRAHTCIVSAGTIWEIERGLEEMGLSSGLRQQVRQNFGAGRKFFEGKAGGIAPSFKVSANLRGVRIDDCFIGAYDSIDGGGECK